MSKIRKIICFIIICILFISTYVYADDLIKKPLIELTSTEVREGHVAEVKLNIKYKEEITAGGITLSYNNKLEDMECISSDQYISFIDVDQSNGKIIITFSNNEDLGSNDENSQICTLKFKVPRGLKQDSTSIKIEKVNDLYSNSEYLETYLFKDSNIQILRPNYMLLLGILAGFSLIIAIIIIALVQDKKSIKRKYLKHRKI